jgi:hypothetical protein
VCAYIAVLFSPPNRFGVSADTILGETFDQNSKRGKCVNKGKMCGKLKGKTDPNREQNIDKWGEVPTLKGGKISYLNLEGQGWDMAFLLKHSPSSLYLSTHRYVIGGRLQAPPREPLGHGLRPFGHEGAH